MTRKEEAQMQEILPMLWGREEKRLGEKFTQKRLHRNTVKQAQEVCFKALAGIRWALKGDSPEKAERVLEAISAIKAFGIHLEKMKKELGAIDY